VHLADFSGDTKCSLFLSSQCSAEVSVDSHMVLGLNFQGISKDLSWYPDQRDTTIKQGEGEFGVQSSDYWPPALIRISAAPFLVPSHRWS
jgi:hypothetical protein